jgi:hypothetical protein
MQSGTANPGEQVIVELLARTVGWGAHRGWLRSSIMDDAAYAEIAAADVLSGTADRCKRFDDAEPLPSRRSEHRADRCKRFDDAEPLPSRRREHRADRCKRFHDVEPLPSRRCEHAA